MQNFFYTKTQKINDLLEDLEEARKKILLQPLSPARELNIRFEALQKRIYYHFLVQGIIAKREHIFWLLAHTTSIPDSKVDRAIIQYKHLLDYLYQSWLVSDEKVDSEVISYLYTLRYSENLSTSPTLLERTLQYLQIQREHPVIDAAVVYIIMLDLLWDDPHAHDFSQIVTLLFLYKEGYDVRGLLMFEDYFFQNKSQYDDIVKLARKGQNLTEWIEFFLKAVSLGLKEASSFISKNKHLENNSLYELTSRQKGILGLFTTPGARVTNRDVQRAFNVSQITASRDLAKLSSLGLIFASGKGRSVYYTKV